MKNSSHPIQTYRKSIHTVLKNNVSNKVDIDLVPNQFYDYNELIGLFSYEHEPYNYFTMEDIKMVE